MHFSWKKWEIFITDCYLIENIKLKGVRIIVEKVSVSAKIYVPTKHSQTSKCLNELKNYCGK